MQICAQSGCPKYLAFLKICAANTLGDEGARAIAKAFILNATVKEVQCFGVPVGAFVAENIDFNCNWIHQVEGEKTLEELQTLQTLKGIVMC